MNKKESHNFSAGPAILPKPVLEKAQKEFVNYNGFGMSVMEMSHRSKYFEPIIEKTKTDIRRIMQVPESHDILFLQGGASLQFSMVPLNLAEPGKPMDVVNTGSWTQKAIKEIKKVGECRELASSEDKNFTYIPEVTPQADSSFLYITSNNTIFGTQWSALPKTEVPLVIDMSSDIVSRPLDIGQTGLIFAGAQKNIGPSGVTLVVIDKKLANRAPETLPSMLQYRLHMKQGSMYNTPPTFGIYMMGLVMEWIDEQGGLTAIERRNQEKAKLLYDAIDQSEMFTCPVERNSRSLMNVVFRVTGNNEELEKRFVQQSEDDNLIGLKGHRSVGGLRASIYNAMPLSSVEALIDFMGVFEKQHAKAVTNH